MADENTTVVEPTENTTQAVEPTPSENNTTTSTETTQAEVKKPDRSSEDWRLAQMQRRIDKLTAQKADAEAKLVAVQKTGSSTPQDEAEFLRRVEEKAAPLAAAEAKRIAAQEQFARDVNAVVDQGREAYGVEKFNEKTAALRQLHDQSDPDAAQRYVDMLAAIIETGEAPKVLYALGDDINEASRIMNLSPVKQGVALAKLANAEIKDVSKAPKPITPVGGRGPSHDRIDPNDASRSDNLSTAEWMARRAAHVADQRSKGVRMA